MLREFWFVSNEIEGWQGACSQKASKRTIINSQMSL